MSTKNISSTMLPLISDPERQAIDSLRGYDYQIWCTVETWLRLRNGEMLCIECAEDFDVVSSGSAVVTQVKNSCKNISLNSTDVKDAIANFWRHQERNSNQYPSISMRFLTRGGIAKEQSSDLGTEKGLELWKKAADGDEESARLVVRHLKQQNGSVSFRNFLNIANMKELKEKLLSRIIWLTEEPSIDAVVLAVERLTINLGNQTGIAPTISKRAVAGLLERCREVARNTDPDLRTLTLQDAQLAFNENSTLQVPLTKELISTFSQLISTPNQENSQAITFSGKVFDGDLPELPMNCLPREDFVKEMTSLCQTHFCLLVVGSEGEGKSTSANILARQIGSSSYWMDLRGGDEKSSVDAIENALLQVRRSSSRPESIILDDLPVANGISDELWGRLKILIDTARRTRVVLVITSKGVSLDSVDPKLKAAGVANIAVPRITKDETIQYFLSLGCPNKLMAETFSELTFIHSGNGHPKLVHLAGFDLHEINWNLEQLKDLLITPKSINAARSNARQRASKTVKLPDRNLLFALSLSLNAFDRTQVLDLGHRLNINEPGAAFDRLNGRWIERYGQSTYKVTPLLNNQAKELWSIERVKSTHGMLLDVYMNRKVIGAWEVLGLFFHALFAEDPKRFLPLVDNLISEVANTPNLAEYLKLLVTLGDRDNQNAIAFDSTCSLIFRCLQFQIAKLTRPEALPEISRRWRFEIERLPMGILRTAMLSVRGVSVATAIEGSFSSSQIFEAMVDVIGSQKLDLPISKTEMPKTPLMDSSKEGDLVPILFYLAQSNSSLTKDLSNFLDTLDKLEGKTRDRLLGAFDLQIVQLAGSVFHRALTSESKKTLPDWNLLANTLERALILSKKWKQLGFGVAAVKVLAVVLSEHLNQRSRARNMLSEILEEFPSNKNIRVSLAKIEFAYGENEKALSTWTECLYGSPRSVQHVNGVIDPYTMRHAGIAASNLSQHGLAAEWFEAAAKVVSEHFLGIPSVSFRIDAVYCWIQHGDAKKALQLSAEILEDIGEPIDPQKSPRLFAAHKLLGLVLLSFWEKFKNFVSDSAKPFAGMASNPNLDIAALGKLVPTPREMCILMIFECATFLKIEDEWLLKLSAVLESTLIPIASLRYWLHRFHKSLSLGQYSQSLIDIYHANEAYLKVRILHERQELRFLNFEEQVPVELFKQDYRMASWAIALVLTLAKINKSNLDSLLASWKPLLAPLPHSASLLDLASKYIIYFCIDKLTATKLVINYNDDLECIGAAACVLSEDPRTPVETSQAQLVLVYLLHLNKGAFFDLPLTTLFTMFSRHWIQHMQTPALLVSPRLNLPQLEMALNNPDTPSKNLVRLLKAGAAASGTSIPNGLLNRLKELVNTESTKEILIAKFSETHYSR